MKRALPAVWSAACLILVLVGAGSDRSVQGVASDAGTATTAKAPAVASRTSDLRNTEAEMPSEPPLPVSAPLYNLNWWSVNGGGATSVTGTNFRMGVSAGQSAAGFASGTNFKLGVGFWYGAASGACPIALSGDVNTTGTITSSDIIVLVNYVFKGGAAPLPCAANGDVNCNGGVTSADIITLVNFVFKGGAAPCNICTIIPSLWSCP